MMGPEAHLNVPVSVRRTPGDRLRTWWMFLGTAVILLGPDATCTGEFQEPVRITNSAENYRLTRISNSHMAFDSNGGLHVTYWSGGFGTTPVTPSFIYYRAWDVDTGWSPQETIDDSTVNESHLGGRHPCIAITPDDMIHVVWHDYRDCTEGGNWIENVEIYGDAKTIGGAFADEDIRLTATTAAHLGDNGYVPRLAVHDDGRISLAWYDFHVDGDVSDVHLRISDETGLFAPGESIETSQVTNQYDRGNAPSFTLPDLAVDSQDTRHLVWVGGFGAGGDLYYAESGPSGGMVSERVLAAGAADFFDPPHITTAPNDDVWVVFGDDSVSGGEDVVLLRRRPGEGDFDAPITIAGSVAREFAPDCEIDSDGLVHLVWIDERTETHVHYGVFDPNLPGLVDSFPLTETSGPWARPTIALDKRGEVYVLWEENTSILEGDLWFATTARTIPSHVQGWQHYR